jgi:hypothetical protein
MFNLCKLTTINPTEKGKNKLLSKQAKKCKLAKKKKTKNFN